MVQPIVSHTTYIAIGIVAIVMLVSAVYTLQTDIEKADTSSKLNYIAGSVEYNILELNSINSDNLEARIKIGSPKEYLLTLEGNMITVKGDDTEVTREVNVPLSGKEYFPAYLELKNNVITVLGENDIIAVPIPPGRNVAID